MRLTDEERKLCDETIDKLVGRSQQARRARILWQVDTDGRAGPIGSWRQPTAAARRRLRTRCGTRPSQSRSRRGALRNLAVAVVGQTEEGCGAPEQHSALPAANAMAGGA